MPSDQFHRVEKLTGECEQIRYIGTKDNPSFTNSWVNFGGSNEDAGFYKDKFNRVWLGGSIKSGTVGTGTPAFTLPTGYRPTAVVFYSSVDGSGTPSARVVILTDGSVEIRSGNNTQIGLDGVSWRI